MYLGEQKDYSVEVFVNEDLLGKQMRKIADFITMNHTTNQPRNRNKIVNFFAVFITWERHVLIDTSLVIELQNKSSGIIITFFLKKRA